MGLWVINAAANAAVAVAYLAISYVIFANLGDVRGWRHNLLAVATGAIFLTCAVHHGTHSLHMVGPTFGFEDTTGRALRQAFGVPHVVVWDVITAGVGAWYWTLRNRLPGLVGGAAVFDDLRQRERHAAEAQRRLEQVLEGLGEGFLAADPQGTVTFANSPARNLIGGIAAEGRPLWEVLPGVDARVRAELARVLGGGPALQADLVTPEQQTLAIWAYRTPDGVGVRISDVTEHRRSSAARARLEEEVSHLRRLDSLGSLAGGVAHDFNNLLTVINGTAEALLLSEDDELADGDHGDHGDHGDGAAAAAERRAARRTDLDAIARAGERAARLTRQLLTFSRRETVAPGVVDVNETVRELQELIARTVGENINVSFDLDDTLPPVVGNAMQLEQVLMNLVVNARDAMGDGGHMMINTGMLVLDDLSVQAYPTLEPGLYVELSVTDTGRGMDAETARRAFEPFFTTKERGRGTGFGLATVYGIVTAAGGHVTIYSEPGAGTRVRVWLPIAETLEGQPAAGVDIAAPAGSGRLVLVVEDDDDVRSLAASMLTRGGYRVVAANDGPSALALLRQHVDAIDAVLSDVVLPGMSGPAVLEQLRSERPLLPVLFMSGYTDRFVERYRRALPDFHLIDKPFTAHALLSAMGALLDSSASSDA